MYARCVTHVRCVCMRAILSVDLLMLISVYVLYVCMLFYGMCLNCLMYVFDVGMLCMCVRYVCVVCML